MSFYCAVKDGKAYEGSRREITDQIFNLVFSVECGRIHLRYEVPGYAEEKATWTWNADEYTIEEAHTDAVITLWRKLPEYGFHRYSKWD